MRKDNLKLESFEFGRDAWLKTGDGQRVRVPSAVLKNAFITRAWHDRTLTEHIFGKTSLGAEVQPDGQNFVATEIWIALEKNSSIESSQKGQFKNFGLELHKPRPFDNSGKKPGEKLAGRFKKDPENQMPGDLCNFRFDNDFLKKLAERQLKNANALTYNRVLEMNFTPDWRLVTGMGEASVYDTHLTLHQTYGIPYIPASSIKGMLRHFLTQEKTAQTTIERVFGENDRYSSSGKPIRGQCIFFDAFPTKAPRIELDVMTPHYPKYYTGSEFPADWQDPTPIPFLTVGHGTSFQFLIGLPDSADFESLKTELEVDLKNALENFGLGGKTAVGYGFWQEDTNKPTSEPSEREEVLFK